jgi:hypothetical protein
MNESFTGKRGNRVRIKRIWVRGKGEHGGETGVIVALPGELKVPPNLVVVKLDDGTVVGVDPMGLELIACTEDSGTAN